MSHTCARAQRHLSRAGICLAATHEEQGRYVTVVITALLLLSRHFGRGHSVQLSVYSSNVIRDEAGAVHALIARVRRSIN